LINISHLTFSRNKLQRENQPTRPESWRGTGQSGNLSSCKPLYSELGNCQGLAKLLFFNNFFVSFPQQLLHVYTCLES
jgi:hypothetical protein